MTTGEIATDEGFAVRLPSGADFVVLTDSEVRYVEERRDRYLNDNHFVNIADLQDIDRLVMMELLVFRWSHWLSLQKDYFGEAGFDEKHLREMVHRYSSELRQLKTQLGIDKTSRDKQKGQDDVTAYLERLRQRAKEFGVVRNTQAAKAIEMFMRLDSLVTLLDNCDQVEREELGLSADSILDWFRGEARPAFRRIDEQFRATGQRYWIRDQ